MRTIINWKGGCNFRELYDKMIEALIRTWTLVLRCFFSALSGVRLMISFVEVLTMITEDAETIEQCDKLIGVGCTQLKGIIFLTGI